MNFKLIVFDWDGTLVDSEQRIVESMQGAIADLKAEQRGHDQVKRIIGLGLAEAIQRLFPACDEQFVEDMRDRYRAHFFSGSHRATLFPGVHEVLDRLEAAGYFLAVATGKSRRGLEEDLQVTGLKPHFLTTRCADEAHSKPHPQMLQDVMNFVGVEPDETLMIGDTEFDLEMANNAGTRSIAVSYGVHDMSDLLKHNPLAVLDTLSDLFKYLPDGPAAAINAFKDNSHE